MKQSDSRPQMESITTSTEFRKWYWIKDELISFCKSHSLPYSKGKFELIDIICEYLDTGSYNRTKTKKSPSSNIDTFDWRKGNITLNTVIDSGYTNSHNVRNFMKQHIPQFSFKIDFMEWVQANTGKTMGDAVMFMKEYYEKVKKGYKPKIKAHNQYNLYTHDYFKHNSNGTLEEVRALWKKKKSQAGDGTHIRYEKSDHDL